MIINQLFAILLPSIVALKIDNNINSNKKTIFDQAKNYLLYVLFINIICYIIIIYILKQPDIIFTYLFTIKYIILSIIFSIILPIICAIISNNVTFKLRVEKNEKNN